MIEYKKYKEVSAFFNDRKGICDFLYFREKSLASEYKTVINNQLDVQVLTDAFNRVMSKLEKRLPPSKMFFSGIVGREPVPVKTKITSVRKKVAASGQVSFDDLFVDVESRSEIVAVFLAVLELVRNLEISFEVVDNKVIINNGGIDG